MREIKFRAWELNEKKMFYTGDSINEHGASLLMNLNGDLLSVMHKDSVHYDMCWARIGHQLVLMQYTNLKDKNNKEIYEGDILKETCQRFPSTPPGYDEEIWSFTDMYELWHQLDPVVGWAHNEIEIIGNIYENPELLKN